MKRIIKQHMAREPMPICPHCSARLDEADESQPLYTDGETVTLAATQSNAHCGLLWGRCDACFESLYLFELALIPAQHEGVFINDYCWHPERHQRYWLREHEKAFRWQLTRYQHVSDVSVLDRKQEPKLISCAWLDLHHAPEQTAETVGDAFEAAAAFAASILAHDHHGDAAADGAGDDHHDHHNRP